MISIHYIHPGYKGVDIWRASSNGARVSRREENIKRGFSRYQRFEAVREILQEEGLGRPDYQFAKNDKHVEYEVLLKSGHTGWRSRLKASYSSLSEFRAYCEIYGAHKRLGYKTPEDAWKANPVVEGGVMPSDYRKAKQQ